MKTPTKKTKSAPKAKRDYYQEITNNIIELIESGSAKSGALWDNKNAFDAFNPIVLATGGTYTGINKLIIGLVMMAHDYQENKWMTYKQAQDAGFQVRKGEKGVQLCKYGSYEKENNKTGEKEDIFFLNSFTTFNVAQIDGYVAEPSTAEPAITVSENCDFIKAILANTDVTILSEKGDRAFYAPSRDAIQMPPKACFISEASYYSVMLHECIHSTSHKTRLGRGEVYKNAYENQRECYAREELVAELGAAFLSSEIGYTQENLEHHASYLESWLSVLKNDKKAIFKAAADAQKATSFIIDRWVKGNKAEADTDATKVA